MAAIAVKRKYDFRCFREDQRDLRFKPEEQKSKKVWRVASLWDNHREIIRLVALGQKDADIAETVNMSKKTVERIRLSPIVQKHLAIMRGAMDADTIDLGIRIRELAPKALDIIEEVITKGKVMGDKVSSSSIVKIAERHLDRAGYAPVKKFMGITGHLSAEDIDRIKERARMSSIIADSAEGG